YIADEDSGFHIINVKNPTNPDLVGSYDTPGKAYNVFVQDSLAYVADRYTGLLIINVSDPANPDSIGGYYDESDVVNVFVRDGFAYLASHSNGLHIIDVSDPTSPTLLGSYRTPGNCQDVFAQGEFVYVADRYSLMIFQTPYGTDVEEEVEGGIVPTDFVLYQNYPNPFNPETKIQYHLSNPSWVELTIYNLIGQKVKVLVNEFQTPGMKSATWNGLGPAGKTLASGIYFYKLKTDNYVDSKKMLLLK
ncbi:MAG: T9SS type A sorting domain-containing protein, partial [Candidatus Zixiibacteriota bacterium]